MQHNKIPILCTRPLSRDLIAVAEQEGFQVDIVPFIKTEPINSDELHHHIQRLSSQQITAVFTSMNAAEAVITQLNELKPKWRIFCLGSTTNKILVQYFGKEAIGGVAGNASALADTIIKTGTVNTAVFFCGDQRRDELPSILMQKQIIVEEVIVYRTTILNNKISRDYRGILFFSPSAVSGFFSNNTISAGAVLFAIGKTTADTIRKYSENKIVVADVSAKEEVVNRMIDYYHLLDKKESTKRN
jgi:uroporphyrinogen-III synthase